MTAETPQPTPPPSPDAPAPWSVPAQTPAGPAPGLRYAGFWVRVVAFILDAIVIGVITTAIGAVTGTGTTVVEADGSFSVNSTSSSIGLLINLVYFVGFWAWRGQSPGMIPFNMRIAMADDGARVDVVRCLLRYVGLLISFSILFLGVIWVGFDQRKQGWHDKIAGTVVVRPT